MEIVEFAMPVADQLLQIIVTALFHIFIFMKDLIGFIGIIAA